MFGILLKLVLAPILLFASELYLNLKYTFLKPGTWYPSMDTLTSLKHYILINSPKIKIVLLVNALFPYE